jgi:hypothetical protein
VTTQPEFMSKYGARVPLWIGFDQDGKQVGEVSQAGNRAAINPVTELLERTAIGYVKPTLTVFVEKYRDFVRDLTALEGKRRALANRKETGNNKDTARNLELEKDGKAIEAEEKRLLAREKELLDQARVQPRDPAATRMGGSDRERGGK